MHKLKPVEEHPILRGIFKTLYLIKIPEMYLRNEEDIRSRGSFTTGDNEQDIQQMNNLARTYRTINDMYELWKNGVDIYVVNYNDTEKIYNAIQEHLNVWLSYINRGIGVQTSPIDDLLGLDQFANVVYNKAKYVFTAENIQTVNSMLLPFGLTMNPLDFSFKGGKGVRFNHYFLNDREKMLSEDINYLHLEEREDLQKEFIQVAARYGIGTKEEKDPVKPLGFDLKFGNEK